MSGPNPGGGESTSGSGSVGSSSNRRQTGANPLDRFAPNTGKHEARIVAIEKAIASQSFASQTDLITLQKRIQQQGRDIAELLVKLEAMDTTIAQLGRPPAPSTTIVQYEATDEVEEITVTADIPAFVAVTITGARADSANLGHFGKVVGVAANDILGGFSGKIELSGFIENPAWTWTPGSEVYLNGTGLSHTAPSTGFVQQIGIAKSATVLFVDIKEPILI